MQHDDPKEYVFTTLRFDEILRDSCANTATSGGLPSRVYLLAQHHARLQEAAEAYFAGADHKISTRIPDVQSLDREAAQAVSEFEKRDGRNRDLDRGRPVDVAFRVKLACFADGRLGFDVSSAPRLSADVLFPQTLGSVSEALKVEWSEVEWTVVLDVQPTVAATGTRHKVADRTAYERARRDAAIESFQVKKEVLLYDASDAIMDASITTPYFLRGGRWVTPAMSYGGQRGATRRYALSTGLCVEARIDRSSVQPGEVIWLSNAARGFFQAKFLSSNDHT